jgi:hypothetical protein
VFHSRVEREKLDVSLRRFETSSLRLTGLMVVLMILAIAMTLAIAGLAFHVFMWRLLA